MKWISQKMISKIKSVLEKNEPVAILSHVNPDGDAAGSVLALWHYLVKNGVEVKVLLPNAAPEFLQWLPGYSKVLLYTREPDLADEYLEKTGIILYLDFNDPKRLSRMQKSVEANKNAVRILVDHHPNPLLDTRINISDVRVSSTAELVFYLVMELNGGIFEDREFAECIYTGIMTDTGCFSFNSSLPSTWEAVAALLKTGLEKDRIFNLVYNNFSMERMRLLGYSLDQKMKVIPEYHTAYLSLTREEMKKYKFAIGDSEGFVNYPLSIKGVLFSVLFIEKKNHVKMSFRSRSGFAVNDIAARYFNGGGHKNAAGGESYDTLDKTIEKFIALLGSYSKWLR